MSAAACNVCGVEYDPEYEGSCQEFAPSATDEQILSGKPPLCPGIVSLTATLERRLVKAEEQADTLANALDCFFYDLGYTAPEMVGSRLDQLGNWITDTMMELGYPKKGVAPKPEAEAA